MKKNNIKICIFGLGYVGIKLAVHFSKKYKTIGFDSNIDRINELKSGYDKNSEVLKKNLINKNLQFTHKNSDLNLYNFFIIAVPTPIKKNKQPDLKNLISATKQIGKIIKKNDIVVFESTVYPGCTEEICIPMLEKISKMKISKDFYCGYSPERINPGDKKRDFSNIIKVTSGCCLYSSNKIDRIYSSVIKAGTYRVDSIKIAEASKVIENTQRDLNIALINEFSIIFNKLNIDTMKVLNAANTKWNFNFFKPGLVGGHCIGVDPYYLAYKSKKINHNPKILLSGRKINEEMPHNVFKRIKSLISSKKYSKKKLDVLILGFTFKENCSDIRNSKVLELIKLFKNPKFKVSCFDPYISKINDKEFKDIKFMNKLTLRNKYDIVILAVSHKYFLNLGFKKIKNFGVKNSIIYDITNSFLEINKLNRL